MYTVRTPAQVQVVVATRTEPFVGLDDATLLEWSDLATELDEGDTAAAIQDEIDRRPSLELYHSEASEDDVGEPWSAPAKPE